MNRKYTMLAGSTLAVLLAACDQDGAGGLTRQKLMPEAGYVADADRGEKHFHDNCARCHGQQARGSELGPPLVNEVYRPSHHANLAFYWAVRDGVKQHHWQFGDMPPIEGLSPQDVADIIAYIRREQRNNGIL